MTVFAKFQTKNGWDESSTLEVFLGKAILKICSKFTGEHQRRGALQLY